MDVRADVAEGGRYLRHVGIAERRKLAISEIGRRTRTDAVQAAEPDAGADSCFFKDELDRWRQLDLTAQFKRFNYRVHPLVSTLAQLMHHKDTIVNELLSVLQDPDEGAWKAYLSLVSVLARDLQQDLYSRYTDISHALKALIDPLSPERTAEVFRTLSVVFRYLGGSLIADSAAYGKHFNEWAAFLQHRKLFLRELSANSLSFLLRKHSTSGQKSQLLAILRGVAPLPAAYSGKQLLHALHAATTPAAVHEVMDGVCMSVSQARGVDLKDGAGRLLFEICRGPVGTLAPGAPTTLEALLAALLPKQGKAVELVEQAVALPSEEEGDSGRSGKKRGRDATTSAGSKSTLLSLAQAHAQAAAQASGQGVEHQEVVRARLSALARLAMVQSAIRADTLAHTLRMCAEHVSPTGAHGAKGGSAVGTFARTGAVNETACEIGWHALLDALDEGLSAWQQAREALGRAEAGGSGEGEEEATPPMPKAKASKGQGGQVAGAPPQRPGATQGPSLEVQALQLHLVSLSLYVGQVCAMLSAWCTHGQGACVPRSQAAVSRLETTLPRLLDKGLWLSPYAAGIARLLLLKLVLACWPFLVLARRAAPVAVVHSRNKKKGKHGGRKGETQRPGKRLIAGQRAKSQGKILKQDDSSEEEATSSSSDSEDEEEEDDGEGSAGGSPGSHEDQEDDMDSEDAGQGSAGAARTEDRAALGSTLLHSIFSLLPGKGQLGSKGAAVLSVGTGPAVTGSTAVDKIAETITAATGGILLPVAQMQDGAADGEHELQYPEVSRAGRSPSFRPAHVASLEAHALVLGFAREMLALATRQQSLDEAEGNGDSGRAEAVLGMLVPPLLQYLQPLVSMPANSSSSGSGAQGTGEEVVISTLLCIRDALLPRGSARSLPRLTAGIGTLLSATGRLAVGSDLVHWFLASLSSMPTTLASLLTQAQVLEDGGDAERSATAHMARIHGLVAATASVDVPAATAIPALLQVFRASVSLGLNSASAAGAGAEGGLPRVLAAVLHTAASALLNATRLYTAAVELESADVAVTDQLLQQLRSVSASVIGTALCVHRLAQGVRQQQTSLDTQAADADILATADAVLLAVLNSCAEFVEAVCGADMGERGFTDALEAVANRGKAEKSKGVKAGTVGTSTPSAAILSLETCNLLTHMLQEVLSGPEHSLRLSALRILAALPSPAYLPVGTAVHTAAPMTDEAALRAAATAPVSSALPSSVPFAPRVCLHDDNVVGEGGSSLTGESPIPGILLKIEALPNALSQERTKITLLTRVGVLLTSKRVPAAHVLLALHSTLGLLHVKFQPLWAATSKVLAIAAEHYPRTTWSIFAKALHGASIARPAVVDRSGPQQGGNAAAKLRGQSRSAARSEAAAFQIVPLRVTALAVAALTGRDPEAVSMAGTVVSLAESLAGHDATGGGAASAADAAIAPGKQELANRLALVIAQGLFGADAGTPALVARLVTELRESSTIASIRDQVGGQLVHANDSVPLSVGEGGHTDTETHHKTLLSVLQGASGWAEARSRVLVPLFLAFCRDDWYGATHAAEPDAHEVRLQERLAALQSKTIAAAERRVEREKAKKGVTSLTGFEQYEQAAEALLAGVVDGVQLRTAARRAPLTARAAASRLVSYLQLFDKWTGWDGIVGRTELADVCCRLLTRAEHGIAEAGLRVLLAMRIPALQPYKDRLLRLCGDKTFREEMVNMPLLASAGVLSSEHRPTVVPIILRLMYGRLVTRAGSGARDSLAARRAAILSYVATVSPGPEAAFFLYLATRPFLLKGHHHNGGGSAHAGAAGAVLGSAGLDAAAPLLDIAPVDSEASASALLARLHSSLAPVDEASCTAAHAKQLVTAAKAVGTLSLLHDIMRQFGTRAEPYLHVILGIVLTCLAETRVRAGQDVDDDDAVETGIEGEGLEEEEDQQEEAERLSAGSGQDEGMAETSRPVFEEQPVPGLPVQGAGGAATRAGSTALTRRARAIRSLALLRLADMLRGYSSVALQRLVPWLPILRACIGAAIRMLPSSMETSSRPSALLHLFTTACADPDTLPLLEQLPGCVAATTACISTGYLGSKAVFAAHWEASVGDRVDGLQTSATQEGGQLKDRGEGPAMLVAAAGFTFLEQLLEAAEHAPETAMRALQSHVPFILQHLVVRMRANVRDPHAFDTALAGLTATGGAGGPQQDIVVPSLRGGVKNFVRQQLTVLGRLSSFLTSGGAAGSSGGSVHPASTAATVNQLMLLLLPYLRNVHRSGTAAPLGFRDSVQLSRSGIQRGPPGPDIPLLALQIVSKLAPLLSSPVPFLPFFSALLAPGPKELAGPARAALLSLLKSFSSHPSLASVRRYLELVCAMGAINPKSTLGELDYDTVLNAVTDLSSPASHTALLSSASSALPAIVNQVLYLAHYEHDMATRQAALNASTALIRSVAAAAVDYWTTVEAPSRAAALASGFAKVPSQMQGAKMEDLPQVQVIGHLPLHVPRRGSISVESAPHESTTTGPSKASHDVALYCTVRLLVPCLRASLNTASPGLRRGFIVLLSDVVTSWSTYGIVHVPSAVVSTPVLPEGAPQGEASTSTSPVRVTTHPALYADLCILSNRTDPEADGWLNLSHVQIHRRARALARLAHLVAAGTLSMQSIKDIILPLTLHSLYDEAGALGGVDVLTVESKGRRVRVGAAADKAGAASGLHAEAVKLLGALGRVLPFSLYNSTMRMLMRLANNAAEEGAAQSKTKMGGAAAASALEKVLVRAIAAMADSLPTLPATAQEGMTEEERAEFEEHLLSAVMVAGHRGGPARGGAGKTAPAPVPRALQHQTLQKGEGQGQGGAQAQSGVPQVASTAPAADADMDVDGEAAAEAPDVAEEEAAEEGEGDRSDAEADEAGEEADAAEEEDAASVTSTPEDLPAPISSAESLHAYKSMMTSIASVLVPGLRKLLRRADASAAPAPDKKGAVALRDYELRPPIAMAMVALCKALPARVKDRASHKLLLDIIAALRSRRFEARETARQTLAKVALTLGPSSLPSIMEQLKRQMTEGYQAHVRGHALYAVLEALSEQLKPAPAPALPGVSTAQSSTAAVDVDTGSVPQAQPAAAAHSFLLASLPSILHMIMDDAVGETAAARGAGITSFSGGKGAGGEGEQGQQSAGYKPSKELKLREAKSSRAGDTMELLARCVPFLPSPAIHSLTAPLIVALEDDRTSAGLATALGREGITTEIVEGLFRRILSGLCMNPSVAGPYVLLYVHGVCSEFLGLTAQSAIKSIKDEEHKAVEEAKDAAAEAIGRSAPASSASLTAYAAPLLLPSFADAYSKFMRLLNRRQERVAAAAAAGAPSGISSWIVHDQASALGQAAGGSGHADRDGGGSQGAFVSGAMRMRGVTVTSTNKDIWRILPEPKLTGTGRYVATDKRAVNSGASSAADVPMSCFALGLLHASMKKGSITSTQALHCEMLDPYIPLLLKIVEDGGHAKLSSLSLRLLSALLPFPLPMLRRVGQRLSKAIIHAVQASSGGSAAQRAALTARSELAQAALKACSVLIRACEWAKVSEEQLRALLTILRADLLIPTRQNATFGMLKAIVGRRLVVVEVYDLMSDVSKLLVTSLRPTGRQAASSVFLQFLLRYPLSDKALSQHLEFFVRNLGYSQEPGRQTVLDVLAAIVARFPQPVLDQHASYLLLPMIVRLSSEPSTTCRAAVGAIIQQLFVEVSHKTALELVQLCVVWLDKGQKAGVRRSAAQVVGIAAEARPDVLRSQAAAASIESVFRALTYEIAHSVADIAVIEERLTVEYEEGKRARAAAEEMQGEEEEEDEEVAPPQVAQMGLDVLEDAERIAVRKAASRVSALLGSGTAHDDPDSDEEQEEDEKDHEADGEGNSLFPQGTAGGGSDMFAPRTTAETGADAATTGGRTGAGKGQRQGQTVSVPLIWEPVYHALVATEKILKALGAAAEAALVPSRVKKGASSSSSYVDEAADASAGTALTCYAHAPEDWMPPVLDSTHAAGNAVAAAANALLYPHAWVRASASRVLGQFFSGKQPEELPAWLAQADVLQRLCYRCVSSLDVPTGLPAAYADQVTKNLVFSSLALRHVVAVRAGVAGVGLAPLDPVVAAGHAIDVGAHQQTQQEAAVDKTGSSGNDEVSGSESEGEEEGEGGQVAGARSVDELVAVFIRATSTASKSAGDITKACVLRWMAAVTLRLPLSDLLRCLVPCVRLLYRLTTVALPERECSSETRALAQEAVELVQAQAGAQAFLHAFNAERLRVGANKVQRRKDKMLQRVLDPEAAAAQKAKRQAAKLRQKKRKIAGYKLVKGKEGVRSTGR